MFSHVHNLYSQMILGRNIINIHYNAILCKKKAFMFDKSSVVL